MTAPPAAKSDPLARLTQAALVLALAAVATRCTMMELNNVALDLGPDGDDGGVGPSTTLVLELLCLLPALLIGVRRAIDPTYVLRWHVSHLLLVGVAAWVTISAGWAGNKFDALIGAGTWWSAAALFWSGSQLVRSWTRWRPVLGLAAGLLMIFVAQAVIYRYIELPETQAYWKSTRDDVLARSGRSADDFSVRRYDQLIASGQSQGFFRSPNTFAAVGVLTAFAAAGLAWQRLRDGDDAVLVVLLAVPVVATPLVIAWAGSRTAGGTAVLAAVGLVAAWRARATLARRAGRAYGVGVGVVLAGAAAVVAIGVATGGLAHVSLTFRWHYWVAAWHMILERPWLGVGWSNFGHAYLAHRLPIAAEEIKDPHNLVLRFVTEAGLIGAALAVAWLALGLRAATRPLAPRAAAAAATAPWNPLGTMAAVAGTYWLMRTATLWPLSLSLLEAIKTVLFAVLLLAGLLVATVRRTTGTPAADDRPAPFTLYAVLAGLLGFLLHNAFDFSMSETGPLLLSVLLLGALLGLRQPSAAGRRTHTAAAIGGLAAGFVLLIAATLLWAVPVWTAEARLAAAEEMGRKDRLAEAMTLGREAIVNAPVPNPQYAKRTLRWTQHTPPGEVLALLGQIINADPADPQAWLNRARFELQRNGPTSAAGADFAAGVRLNPSDAAIRLEYAAFLDAFGRPAEATEQIRLALAANDALRPDEPRRLPAAQVEAFRKRVPR